MRLSSLRNTLLTFAWVVWSAGVLADTLPQKFDPQRDAASDLRTATAQARAQGKRVIVDVGGEWCKWCHFLDHFIDDNADVKAQIDQRFVWVKVNWSPDNKNVAVLSQWPKVRGYPHLFVLDANGKLLHSQDTGVLEAEDGRDTYDRAKFLAFVDKQSGPN